MKYIKKLAIIALAIIATAATYKIAQKYLCGKSEPVVIQRSTTGPFAI